jgi:hypothetical protein
VGPAVPLFVFDLTTDAGGALPTYVFGAGDRAEATCLSLDGDGTRTGGSLSATVPLPAGLHLPRAGLAAFAFPRGRRER